MYYTYIYIYLPDLLHVQVLLDGCSFERNELALMLEEAVTGHAARSSFDSTAFGRFYRPPEFRMEESIYTSTLGVVLSQSSTTTAAADDNQTGADDAEEE